MPPILRVALYLLIALAALIGGFFTVHGYECGTTWIPRGVATHGFLVFSLLAGAAWWRFGPGSRAAAWFPDLGCVGLALLLVLPWFAGMMLDSCAAIDRARQLRTIENVRALGSAIEHYLSGGGTLVDGHDPAALRDGPVDDPIPTDGWGRPLDVRVAGGSYWVVSFGMCSEPDVADPTDYEYGATTRYTSDIVLKDGEFHVWPEGAR